jgi:serine/threonine protein kinase
MPAQATREALKSPFDTGGALPDTQDGVNGVTPGPDQAPVVAGYELLGQMARGGMGEVWQVRDPRFNLILALKTLQPRYAGSDTAKSRFLAEAQITAQLQHPGIPPVHDLGELPDGRPFLAMKLVKDDTLADLLKQSPRPAGFNYLAVFEAIAQAVGYAHAHGIIHRDLKPANVMVGAFGEVQVMDWGLAKEFRSRDANDVQSRDANDVQSRDANDAQSRDANDVQSRDRQGADAPSPHSPLRAGPRLSNTKARGRPPRHPDHAQQPGQRVQRSGSAAGGAAAVRASGQRRCQTQVSA